MSTGRTKGQSFERLVCKQLSLWISNGESDDHLWRTAASGGRATNRHTKGKSTKNAAGDICATTPEGAAFLKIFAVELKCGYSKFSLFDLLDKPAKAVKQNHEKWCEQAEKSRQQSGSVYWMIISKRNKREPVVSMPFLAYQYLYDPSPTLYPTPMIHVAINNLKFVTILLESFTACCTYQQVLGLVNNVKQE